MRQKTGAGARGHAERNGFPELWEWNRPPLDAEEVLHRAFLALGWSRSQGPLPRPPARGRGDLGPFVVANGLPPEHENLLAALDGTGTEAKWRRWLHALVEADVRRLKAPPVLVDKFFARYDKVPLWRLCASNPDVMLLSIAALVDFVVDDAGWLLIPTVERFEQAFELHARLHPSAPRVEIAPAGVTVHSDFTDALVKGSEEAARRARTAVDACRAMGWEDLAVEAERRAPWPTRWRDYLPRAGPGARVAPHRRLTYLLHYALRHLPRGHLTYDGRYRLIADIVGGWTGTEETERRVRQSVEHMQKATVPTPPCGALPPLYVLTLTRSLLEHRGLVKRASPAHELCTTRFTGASVILHFRVVGE